MKPRRTIRSNSVFRLPGGTEDNDLWVRKEIDSEGRPVISSTWQPSDEEREAIAAGANLELIVWGTGMPPVSLGITTELLGRPEATDA